MSAPGRCRYARGPSVRTGLTLHHGTANHADRARAVLNLGAVTAEVAQEESTDVHQIVVTRGYHEQLPLPCAGTCAAPSSTSSPRSCRSTTSRAS